MANSIRSLNVSRVTQKIDWFSLLFIVITHGIALFGTIYLISFHHVAWQTWVLAGIMFCLGGLANSIGYHRLFAHRSFKSSWILKLAILIVGASNCQNSAFKWCSDHRRHHAYTDTDGDPYNVKRGFFYSHIGWLLVTKNREHHILSNRGENWDNLDNIPDLQKDSLISWQHRWYVPLVIATCFLFPMLCAGLWQDYLGGLIIAGFLRMSAYFQCTCLVNSACHYWGSQPYTQENSSRNNVWVALLTFGEGYHNYHHAFPFDYRNGIAWYAWDPSKWLIKLFAFMKLASELRVVTAKPEKDQVTVLPHA